MLGSKIGLATRMCCFATQPINPLSTEVTGQPPATATDSRQISATHRCTDSVKKVLPADATSHLQSQPSKHDAILVSYPLLRPIPVQRTSGGIVMRTRSTYCIGRIQNLDQGLGMGRKGSVDHSHVLNKR